MDAVSHYRRLFAYDDWANREVLSVLRATPNGRSVELMAHIVAAQRVWLDRLLHRTQSVPVWPTFGLDECATHLDELKQGWDGYFGQASPDQLTQTTAYKNTRGEAFTSRNDDILTHVIMHGAYHRGQIALATRTEGSVPAATDFIFCIRQGCIE